jgi:hypothetical protein
LLIYVLWWKKPFDIEEADVIEGDQVPEIFAWMWTRSYYSIRRLRLPEARHFKKIGKEESSTTDDTSARLDIETPFTVPTGHRTNSEPLAAPSQPEPPNINGSDTPRAQSTSARANLNNTTRLTRSRGNSIVLHNDDELLSTDLKFRALGGLKRITLNPIDIKRWKLASKYHSVEYEGSRRRVQIRNRNWPKFEIGEGFNQFWAVAIFAGIIYGGLHAIAWNAVQFPTPTERLLWRISASIVMSGGLVEFCLFQLGGLFGESPDVTVGLTFGAYALARAYLVVECFLSLFHSPAGIYDLPQWSSYVPHIS